MYKQLKSCFVTNARSEKYVVSGKLRRFLVGTLTAYNWLLLVGEDK